MGFVLPPMVFLHQRIDFPSQVDEVAFLEGQRLEKEGFKEDSVLGREFQAIGFWFDGRIKRPVDHVVWVNSELVSRWLGWISEKEEWNQALIDQRWNDARQELGGKLTFLLCLCSFPRLDPLGFGTGKEASPNLDLAPYCNLQVQLGYPYGFSASQNPQWQVHGYSELETGKFAPQLCWSQQAFTWHPFWNRPFYEQTPLQKLFASAVTPQSDEDPPLPLGNYYGAEWMVQIPTAGLPPIMTSIDFQIFRSHRENECEFKLNSDSNSPDSAQS